MTDLELFKAIVRATRDVPMHEIGKAIERVRALVGSTDSKQIGLEDSRKATGTRNRKYLGGMDRSEDESA